MENGPKDKRESKSVRYVSPAVEQASRILFCLAGNRAPYMSLIEICAQVGIHKSKAFTILETLQRFGLVRKNEEGKGYGLGPGLVSLSRKVLDDMSAPRLAQPILEELALKTKSTAVLGLVDGEGVFIAAKHEWEGTIGVTIRIGHRLPLTYGAHGKAIVAFMPEGKREEILAEKRLYFHGAPARLDLGRLREELARCRKDGFAEDLGVSSPGLNVVAAPVMGPKGSPTGFIEIFVLFSPDTARRWGPLVVRAAQRLSRELGAVLDEELSKSSIHKSTRTRTGRESHDSDNR